MQSVNVSHVNLSSLVLVPKFSRKGESSYPSNGGMMVKDWAIYFCHNVYGVRNDLYEPRDTLDTKQEAQEHILGFVRHSYGS